MQWPNACERSGGKDGRGASPLRSETTDRFWNLYSALPKEVQQRARKAHELFEQDPQHPGLNFKRVRGTQAPIYSVRIDRNYRAVGLLEHDAVTWFWIGSHADDNRLIEGR